MSFNDRLAKLLAGSNIHDNLPRKKLIQAVVDNKEAFISKCGALATWTPPESTGRSPLDTLMVKRPESEATIDWTAANNIPLDPETFDMMVDEIQQAIGRKEEEVYSKQVLYEANRPENMGALEEPDASGGITGPCGDTIMFDLRVDSNRVISEIMFRTNGCGATVACASMVTKLIKGRTLTEARKLDSEKLEDVLGGLPDENKHCAVLSVESLNVALDKLGDHNDK